MTIDATALPRFSYRPLEIQEMTGITRTHLYHLIKRGIIPTVSNTPVTNRSTRGVPRRQVRYVLIPAWAFEVFQETEGCWPGDLPEDDPRRLPPNQRPAA